MSSWRTWLLYGGLVLLATFAGLLLRNPEAASTVPSVRNSQPRGIRALFLYLQESGRDARPFQAPWTELPADARTVVLVAPVALPITPPERETLQRFVEGGGTLVYLTPTTGAFHQPELVDWLQLTHGRVIRPTTLRSEHDLEIWHPHGLFTGLQRLRTGARMGLGTDAPGAVAIAGAEDQAFAWYIPVGKGEVYAFAGADLAQNQWLDAGDNATVWERLGRRGPILFDEGHHVPPPPLPASWALWSVALQLAAVTLAFFWSRGVRLGPARPSLPEKHRSTREYLESFGWLLRRARVELELLRALRAGVRRRLWERASIPPALSEEEAAARWAEQTGESIERYDRWRARMDAAEREPVSPRRFAQLCAEAAAIESSLGR